MILDALRPNANAETIRDHYRVPLAGAKWWQERVMASDEDFEIWLRQNYLAPEGPFTRPAVWRSLTWGNPAQPVVGVCWYEARAYCLWLNAVLDTDRYRLPSEAEWEAAGRGWGAWRLLV
jgi:formylglycine-generating enzyme required for sulfatase activity